MKNILHLNQNEGDCLQILAPIFFYRNFVDWTGDIKSALMLSYLIGTSKTKWLRMTAKDWEDTLGLTQKEQKNARRKLCMSGLMIEELRGVPPVLHFRINQENFVKILDQGKK